MSGESSVKLHCITNIQTDADMLYDKLVAKFGQNELWFAQLLQIEVNYLEEQGIELFYNYKNNEYVKTLKQWNNCTELQC